MVGKATPGYIIGRMVTNEEFRAFVAAKRAEQEQVRRYLADMRADR